MNRSRIWREANPAKVLLYQARRRARAKSVPFTLTLADVERLFAAGRCEYCDLPVGAKEGPGCHPQSATLDRLVPSVGYTAANIVLACHKDNSAKAEHTPESLRAWAIKIETLISQRQNPNRDDVIQTKHEIILQDEQERQAYNQFVLMLEKYRNAQWIKSQEASEPPSVPDATGSTEPPAEDPAVVGHITPELTYDELLEKLRGYVATHTPTKARELLTEFGINRLPELPKERYAEFAARLGEVLVTA